MLDFAAITKCNQGQREGSGKKILRQTLHGWTELELRQFRCRQTFLSNLPELRVQAKCCLHQNLHMKRVERDSFHIVVSVFKLNLIQ